MSARLTQQVWETKDLTPEKRVFLLALAEVASDQGSHVELSFAALMHVDQMLGWESETTDPYARATVGMEPDEPMGHASGTYLDWAEAIERVRSL